MKNAASDHKGIVFLTAERIYWSQEGLQNILQLDLPQGAIQHLEVIKEQEIANSFKGFLDQNKIVPSHCVILLAPPLLFSQTISNKPAVVADTSKTAEGESTTPDQRNDPKNVPPVDKKGNKSDQKTKDEAADSIQSQIEQYLNVVPFENIGVVTIPGNGGTTVISANQDYYDCIKGVMSASGFIVDAIAPVTILGSNFASAQALDAGLIKATLGAYETLKKNSLTTSEKTVNTEADQDLKTDDQEIDEENSKPNKRFPVRTVALLGVFFILLTVLGVTAYFSLLKPSSSSKSKNIASKNVVPKTQTDLTPTPQIVNSAAFDPQEASTSALISTLTMQLVSSSSDSASDVNEMRDTFEDLGFEAILTDDTGPANLTRTLVLFSENVPLDVRQLVIQELQALYTSVSSQESASARYDVVINLGQKR